MAKIRVIRVLEYEYDSIEYSLQDQLRWTHTVESEDRRMSMTSTVLRTQVLPDDKG